MPNSPGPDFELSQWLAGLLATLSLGWIAATSKKVNNHETALARLDERTLGMKESIDRLEDHFGTKPKEK